MLSIFVIAFEAVINLSVLIIRLLIYLSDALWDIALQLIPPLAKKFGKAHEKDQRKILIESVSEEKWRDCFERLLEYRNLCFDNNSTGKLNVSNSVKSQMEQTIKDEFGMNISKYMKQNDIKKLDLLLADLKQYILGNIQPSKKKKKSNSKLNFKTKK